MIDIIDDVMRCPMSCVFQSTYINDFYCNLYDCAGDNKSNSTILNNGIECPCKYHHMPKEIMDKLNSYKNYTIHIKLEDGTID
jgi:hypothetical protein